MGASFNICDYIFINSMIISSQLHYNLFAICCFIDQILTKFSYVYIAL